MDDKKESKKDEQEELTWEKFFDGYDGEPFDSELVVFEPIGNEKW